MLTKIRVITTGRNCSKWLERCLESIAAQDYDKSAVKVCVTDDASTDNSAELAKRLCDEYEWECVLNEKRLYALANQWNSIHKICEDDSDVIVFVDADDFLNGTNVFSTLNNYYSDPNVLLTYGSFRPYPDNPVHPQSIVRAFPIEVINDRSYRRFQEVNGIYWNHLRTFRYGPFKNINKNELQYPGSEEFFTASPDTAIMVPMLELVGDRFRYIREPLLVYNTLQDEPDWSTHGAEIRRADAVVYSLPKKERWTNETYL